ncbi:signal peptide peptidase SppA [Pseudemcibacter aquimaris]|nr:signal peptide peptidase SppA [Pseudemcibacter aquimaris]
MIVMIILCSLFIGGVLFDSSEQKIDQKNAALLIDFKGTVVEQEAYSSDPYEQLLAGEVEANTRLRDVVQAIEHAKNDDNISSIILNFKKFNGGMPSKLHYIGSKLDDFKESGKKIYAYGNLYDQGDYLIASHADEIYMHPHGAALLYGYGGFQNYFAGFLEKIKAEVQLFRVGKYKSAMEPYTRSDMSDEAKEANMELYGGLWDHYVSDVSSQRGISEDALRSAIDNSDSALSALGGDLGKLALESGLVDGLKTREEWVTFLQDIVGEGPNDSEVNVIGFRRYLIDKNGLNNLKIGGNQIAIVYATGTIMDGDMPQGTVGGDTMSRQLREARQDDNVKAVVLRIDTPGGSAFASELIRQEVLLLKEAGKPVIASMASVAASGGYWIAANADQIWASPTTITGSIGIFGAVPNIEGTLAEIGINTDGIGTTDLIAPGLVKPLPEKVSNIIQSNIENGYQRFLNIVAEGRGMTTEQVDEIAQGRVWTGEKALELGLVDNIGNIDQAIAAAVELAELSDYKVIHWEDELPFEMQLIRRIMNQDGNLQNTLDKRSISPEQILLKKIRDNLSLFSMMNDPGHAYLLCLTCVDGFNPQY